MTNTATMNANAAPGAQQAAGMFPLMGAGSGQRVRVCQIRGKDDTRKFLAGLGFCVDSEVNIVSQQGGDLIVEAKGARIALTRQMACRIMVCSV